MIRKRILSLLCAVLTLAGMLAIAWVADRVLIVKRTDGIVDMQDFYAQKENTVDVLLLGSSHAGMNLDASVFWTEQGQSAFALWGSVQPFWNTYHYLLEALKTQRPRVVLLDVYAAGFDFEYSDPARQVTNVCGMRPSRNKWEAIQVSAPRERWINLALGLPVYHNRYAEITADDFQHFPWTPGLINDKGTYYRYGFGAFPLTDISWVQDSVPMLEKEEIYLRKIIETCRDEQLPLVLILTPTVGPEYLQLIMNTVSGVAAEYDLPFYNFNQTWMEVGINEDDFWLDGHLNTLGARKISSFLAQMLKDRYALPDHRGDPDYASWDVHAETVRAEYEKLVAEEEAGPE